MFSINCLGSKEADKSKSTKLNLHISCNVTRVAILLTAIVAKQLQHSTGCPRELQTFSRCGRSVSPPTRAGAILSDFLAWRFSSRTFCSPASSPPLTAHVITPSIAGRSGILNVKRDPKPMGNLSPRFGGAKRRWLSPPSPIIQQPLQSVSSP